MKNTLTVQEHKVIRFFLADKYLAKTPEERKALIRRRAAMRQAWDDSRLSQCTFCGCHGSGMCGRMIAKDGSVWPSNDTGFRMRSK